MPGGKFFLNFYPSAYEGASFLFSSQSMETDEHYWDNTENIRKFLKNLAQTQRLLTPLEWSLFFIQKNQFEECGGKGLLEKGNLYQNLCDTFPEVDWETVRPAIDPSFWESSENQRNFLDFFADYQDLNRTEELIVQSNSAIARLGGSQLVKKYPSRIDMLKSCYPEITWPPVKKTYLEFKNENLHQEFIKYAEKVFKINKIEDWRKVSTKEFKKIGGSVILPFYKYSVYQVLKKMYPDQIPIDTRVVRPNLAPGERNDLEIQRKYYEQLEKAFHIEKPEDWYKYRSIDILKYSKYHYDLLGNPVQFTKRLFPDYPWNLYRFLHFQPFWRSDFNHHIEYLKTNEKLHNIKSPYEWTFFDCSKFDGNFHFIMKNYNSFLQLLLFVYPFDRDEILKKSSPDFWKDKNNLKTLISPIYKKYSIDDKIKLFCVPKSLYTNQLGVSNALKYHKDIPSLVEFIFPAFKRISDSDFDISDDIRFQNKYLQRFLKLAFYDINDDMEFNKYFPQFEKTVDVYFVKENAAVIYHDEEHYENIQKDHKNISKADLFEFDERIRQEWLKDGIKLIIIPYWSPIDLSNIKARFISAGFSENIKPSPYQNLGIQFKFY